MAERLLIRALKGGKNTKIITLNGKNITKMPSVLEKLPGLKTLYLQNNQISKVCPEISNLTQLTALNLGNNLLEEVPQEMKYLTSLKTLHLFRNKIHRFAPGVCGKLKNLRCLSINHNQLASIPRELCFLENLSELQLNYNQLVCIPKEIKFLEKLQKLLLARNNIKSLPEFQDLKLKEFYCEGNPLFLKWPVSAIKQEDVWSLQEITSRFIMNQLAENNPFLMKAIKWYPQVRSIISQGRKCAICGKFFLTIWLECVEFFPPSKNWKISRNLQLVPLQILICSYKCFYQRNPNIFGIAQ
ncbi:hypothetical protein MJG53_020791, partial [Ovis ammon polii x Ovis aries]